MAIRIREGFVGQRSVELPQDVVEKHKNDQLLRMLLITYIGYYPHAEYHYVDRTQPISDYVLIYCVEGSGHYCVRGKEYTVKRNQYFILPGSESHLYWSDEKEPWTIYWVHFRGELADYYSQGTLSPKSIQPNLTSRISNRNHLFEEIFSTLENGFHIDNLLYASSAFYYYLASMRFLQQYRQSVRKEQKHIITGHKIIKEDNLVKAARHFMEENIEHDFSIHDIARYIGYSDGHFSRLFKQATGKTPQTYLNELRIDRSCYLLHSTDMLINQICYKVGIIDNLYFSRLFKKIKGISPLQYRKQEKNE
ncbi:MAG: AraC family transcriptional regulator [Prevotella sp.]|nr:AraC family transcriptional regulator [Prevotella sp.]